MPSLIEKKISETTTENIFRDFYEPNTFVEKVLYRVCMDFNQNAGLIIKDTLISS